MHSLWLREIQNITEERCSDYGKDYCHRFTKRWRGLWKVSYYEKLIAAHPINLPFSDCATLHKTS